MIPVFADRDPVAQLNRIDAVCDHFEQAWKSGESPWVEEFLAEVAGPEVALLLEHLLPLEIEYREKRGESPSHGEFQTRFPEFGDLVASLYTQHQAGKLRSEQSTSLPRKLDRFELLEVLGSGASGTVYLARDASLDRNVALKVAHPHLLFEREVRERFLREAKSVAKLSHPGIVPVFEVGSSLDCTFIVAEYVAGPTLAAFSARGSLSDVRSIAELVGGIADALEYAHERGIVHRDLKPSNILLARAEKASTPDFDRLSDWRPRIVDFGLARRIDTQSILTREGEVLGTPAYMSPEQAAGEAKSVDARTDVYSLGALFYEQLTGALPFSGKWPGILQQIIHDVPRSPRAINPRLPRDLEVICLKCLEKAPADRYPAAADVRADLRRWLSGHPILARPTPRWQRAWKWCQRRRRQAVLVAVSILVAVLGVGGGVWQHAVQVETERAATIRVADEWLRKPANQLQSNLTQVRDHSDVSAELARRLTDEQNMSPQKLMRLRLALLRKHPEHAETLLEYALSEADAYEFALICVELAPLASEQSLLDVIEGNNVKRNDDRAGRSVLASLAFRKLTQDREPAARTISNWLLHRSERADIGAWARAARELRAEVSVELRSAFQSPDDAALRESACRMLMELHADEPERLVPLLAEADDRQHQLLCDFLANSRSRILPNMRALLLRPESRTSDLRVGVPLAEAQSELQWQAYASAACGLLRLGGAAEVWPHFRTMDDPRLQSYFIHFAWRRKVDADALLGRLTSESDATTLFVLTLALGSYPELALNEKQRAGFRQWLHSNYRTHPDSGVHSAVRWVLRKYGDAEWLRRIDDELRGPPLRGRNWFVNSQGMYMILVASDKNAAPSEDQTGRTFAISADEVTWEYFQRSSKGRKSTLFVTAPDQPADSITAFEALSFCHWLSEHDDLVGQHRQAVTLTTAPRAAFVDPRCNGYRLPLATEWQKACRAGTTTSRFFGSGSYPFCDEYVCGIDVRRPQAVETEMPNRLGLFDTLGNMAELTHCELNEDGAPLEAPPVACPLRIQESTILSADGGSYERKPSECHAETRIPQNARASYQLVGFRVACTISEPN